MQEYEGILQEMWQLNNIRKNVCASAIIPTLSRKVKSKHGFDVFNSLFLTDHQMLLITD